MSSAIEMEGKNFLPIKEANRLVSYSRDYITRLAREKKINAVQVGRQWYVDGESLQNYEAHAQTESEIRKQHLSAERKREREIREAAEGRQQLHEVRHRSLHVRSVVAASLVLCVGLLSGKVAYDFSNNFHSSMLAGGGFFSAETVSSLVDEQLAQSDSPVAVPAVVPASNRKTDALIATATTSQNAIAEELSAVVLLPQGVATTADLFSDEVQVRVASGTTYVELVDESGEIVGEALPFVSVPVVRSSSSHSVQGGNPSSS